MTNTNALRAAVLAKYPANAWALAWEVGDGTGRHCTRHADAVAMGLWPSRGLELHGLEMKVSRTDWLKELKEPSKAESVARYCDRWWLVVSDKAIVKDGELPPTWGLMFLSGDSLKVATDAKPLTPQPIDRVFLAGLMRACAKPAVRDNEDALRKEYERGRQFGMEHGQRAIDRLTTEAAEAKRKVVEFEQAAGFPIEQWRKDATATGAIVRRVLAGEFDRDAEDLKRIQGLAVQIAERTGAELARAHG